MKGSKTLDGRWQKENISSRPVETKIVDREPSRSAGGCVSSIIKASAAPANIRS